MSGDSNYKRKRRTRMWEKNPRCHWCGQLTVLPPYPPVKLRMAPNTATIEHVRSKLHPDRQEPNTKHEPRYVLACLSCNNQRGHRERSLLPRPELWERDNGGIPPLTLRLALSNPNDLREVIAATLWQRFDERPWAQMLAVEREPFYRLANDVLRALNHATQTAKESHFRTAANRVVT